jgi:RNA polymerase sigma factor (sigma-70 family)
MLSTLLGWRKRRWVHEISAGDLPDEATGADPSSSVAQHEVVLGALRRLPERQRAVVVLRYFVDLSEQATAETLGCSVGTVKSHAFRALSALRSNPALRAAIIEESK